MRLAVVLLVVAVGARIRGRLARNAITVREPST